MPAGHESPSGAFKPQTGLQSKCRVFSAARSQLLSTRWTHEKGAARPFQTPKQMGSIQKIQAAPLEDFLCCADFKAPQPLLRQLPAGERGWQQLHFRQRACP